jgi:hypothetical protein
VARVRWYPPNPAHVYRLAADTLENTGNAILAQALRRLARCEAQDDARPNQYIVPDRAAVIDWLQQMRGDIDWTIEFLESEPDAPAQLMDQLPEPFKQSCEACGQTFVPERRSARYCSNACRQRAYRQRDKRSVKPPAPS